jgi:beta-mannosidase
MDSVPASVPGNFELDLQAAGRIPEPFFGTNIADLRRFERHHLFYARRFLAAPAPPGKEALLVLEGVDCFADVYVNGKMVGACGNMLVPHEFRVDGLLRSDAGETNEIVVHIRPSLDEARHFPYPPGATAIDANRFESLYVRKAPHMYGWDILPRALSGGLWRPARIEYRPAERWESVYLHTLSADANRANLSLHFRACIADPLSGNWEIAVEGAHRSPDGTESRFEARVPLHFEAGIVPITLLQPHLWWSRGRGEAALYDVTVRLLRGGEEVDRATFRHGIRTVALRRTGVTDDQGAGEFCFVINGERVFALGTNWVAVDAYHSRDRKRIPELIHRAADELNCNMIRCWGGNVYEDDLFYDLCDEKGILVWQDFSMACALYPQDDAFAVRLAEEARMVVRRLRQHPCVALWAGDNECDQVPSWIGRGQVDPNDNRLTRAILPAVLAEEDPFRPFLPSSPYIDPAAFAAGQRYLPENHLWGPRDNFKSDYYTGSLCHFVSEIGYHGCPDPESVRRFISSEYVWPPTNNPEWDLHSTSPVAPFSPHRVELMSNQIRELFGVVPENLDDYAFASQCVQAEALKFFVEWFRAGMWRRTGILWWNLADGWPQFSDAIVDYYGVKKIAFEYLRRAQQPLHLILREPTAWRQDLVASNIGRESVRLVRFSVRNAATGDVVLEGSGKEATGDSVVVLGSVSFSSGSKNFYRIDWETERYGAGTSHYMAGNPPFDLEEYRRFVRTAVCE